MVEVQLNRPPILGRDFEKGLEEEEGIAFIGGLAQPTLAELAAAGRFNEVDGELAVQKAMIEKGLWPGQPEQAGGEE